MRYAATVFLKSTDVRFEFGDIIEVKGSKFTCGGCIREKRNCYLLGIDSCNKVPPVNLNCPIKRISTAAKTDIEKYTEIINNWNAKTNKV